MKKVIVEGPFLTNSGYGEHARHILRALRTREDIFDIYGVPLRWGKTSWLSKNTEEKQWLDYISVKTVEYLKTSQEFDIHIQVSVPNEFKKKAPYAIGVTAAMETNKISESWVPGLNAMNKIIVPSNHSKKTITTPKFKNYPLNVEVSVHPYAAIMPETKEKFEDFKTNFNFLTVAQFGPRKNIQNTIDWFVQEFHNDEDVGLIVKINMAENSIIDRTLTEGQLKGMLAKYPDKKCKVYLVHGDLSTEEMGKLYNSSNAYLCISHGEGWGLPIFEAAQYELPIITVDWSGQTDFLYIGKKANFVKIDFDINKIQNEAVWENVIEPDMFWAFPKSSSFKKKIRHVKENVGIYKKMAKELKVHILSEFEPSKVYSALVDEIYAPFKGIEDEITLDF